ncbi:hypothetical protein MIR68_000120 [Amoeboaphelidium protococcarum]|nr:hypothetical protein MIR68_000120 [Amoeboaphelidium protococcarum]
MFFLKSLTQRVEVLPSEFGPDIKGTIAEKLTQMIKSAHTLNQQTAATNLGQSSLNTVGSAMGCTGRYGYQIAVAQVEEVSDGEIPASNLLSQSAGSAFYHVKYKAILFKPFKGEVIDCLVGAVNKMGFFAHAGPLQIFVSKHLIPADLEFHEGGGGGVIGGDLGSNMELDDGGDGDDAVQQSQMVNLGGGSAYVNDDGSVRVESGRWVRVRIVGTRLDANEIFAIGTMREDYLGVLDSNANTL